MKEKKNYMTFAAIHLGSEVIRMRIVEYKNLQEIRVIEKCEYPIRLGEETFKYNIISFPVVDEICRVLQDFKREMDACDVDIYTVHATTAVREAANRLFILDQIKIRTGLDVEIVELPREIYTKYTAIRRTVRQSGVSKNKGVLFIDISSGGLGITLLEKDEIVFQKNFHIGILRIKESFDSRQRNSRHFNAGLMQFIAATIGPVRDFMKNRRIGQLVLSGTETALLLKVLGSLPADLHSDDRGFGDSSNSPLEGILLPERGGKIMHLDICSFEKFFRHIHKMNMAQIRQEYNLNEVQGETVLPMVLLYKQLLDLVPEAGDVVITTDTYIDGMEFLQVAEDKDRRQKKELENEIIGLLHSIGRTYDYDYAHVSQVERLALVIFDAIGTEYGLDSHNRLLLRAACILHDIGKYVSMRRHSNYSYELIMGTDILPFTGQDKEVIALTAYYHAHNVFEMNRRSMPEPGKEIVPIVAKLSAILRLADALDRSYLQKIKDCRVHLGNSGLLIEAISDRDLDLEEWTFSSKVLMMEEVYGFKVAFKRVEKL